MIKAVIFDMDGVIIDSEPLYVNKQRDFYRHLGIEISEEALNSTVGSNMIRNYENVFLKTGLDWDFETYKTNFRAFKKENIIDYTKIINPGVKETLTVLLEKGYHVSLASSTNIEKILEILDEIGIHSFFEHILSGDMFKKSKPHPEIYIKSAALLGLRPEECIAIEDSEHGIKSAQEAGLHVAAKIDRRFGVDQSGAHYFFNDIPEIVGLIETINNAKTV